MYQPGSVSALVSAAPQVFSQMKSGPTRLLFLGVSIKLAC